MVTWMNGYISNSLDLVHVSRNSSVKQMVEKQSALNKRCLNVQIRACPPQTEREQLHEQKEED